MPTLKCRRERTAIQRGFNRYGVRSFCPQQCSTIIHNPCTQIVSMVLLTQQFYTGLKCSRSPCTTSECLSCRVCNSSHHRPIYIWSTTSVSGGMQNSPLPFQTKHQHQWSHATATNSGCMNAPFGLICLIFLWNCSWGVFRHSGWVNTSLSFQRHGRTAAFFHLRRSFSIAKSTHSYRATLWDTSAVCKHHLLQCKAVPSVVSFPGRDGICQTLQ